MDSAYMLWHMIHLQVKEGTNLFIIDEVGKMELYSSSFFPAVLRILDSSVPFLASIPIPKSGRDIPGGAMLFNCSLKFILFLMLINKFWLFSQLMSRESSICPDLFSDVVFMGINFLISSLICLLLWCAVARLRNHPGATIFSLNPGNRDAMKDRIYSQIVSLLES